MKISKALVPIQYYSPAQTAGLKHRSMKQYKPRILKMKKPGRAFYKKHHRKTVYGINGILFAFGQKGMLIDIYI